MLQFKRRQPSDLNPQVPYPDFRILTPGSRQTEYSSKLALISSPGEKITKENQHLVPTNNFIYNKNKVSKVYHKKLQLGEIPQIITNESKRPMTQFRRNPSNFSIPSLQKQRLNLFTPINIDLTVTFISDFLE